ncbi:nuclear factor related to kappa-B-binding protein isoform X1 [Tribolium madens]|uniref:nuclear factor related to kappa-B-binding protein isoform X1 n=1 Tax=Tribolium madens TaxID=41895 RepID=UPI001CF73324|nr:nuclear factor related to kappa-B-binding protein isoform X1 [Tribolium madens]XP_044256105.1 nuclear factor related to kappa-B-binding protein isoform X1 [Tribolium madens]
MDSDTSDDTSDYSTESSDDDGMETAEIYGTKLQLPQGLCERKDIFLSVLSSETWNSLSDDNKEHLQTFLPNFPENDEEEKNKTLEKLFSCDTFRFNNPLEKFHEDLKDGYFRPDIANMRRIIKKAQKKEAMYRYKKFREKLKQDVIESQQKLLNQINNLPPGVEPKIEKIQDPNLNYIVHRTKRRYYQILASIQAKTQDNYCSPDENYPEGPPVPLSRKQRRHLNSIRNNYASTSDIFMSTMSTKANGLDLEKFITPLRNPFYITDETYKTLISQHKRRKLERIDDPEYNTKGITLSDIVNRTQLPYIKNLTLTPKHHTDNKLVKKKRKEVRLSTQSHSSNSDNESDSDSYVDAVTVNHAKKVKTNRNLKSASKNIKNEVKTELFTPPKPDTPTTTTNKPIPFSQYGKITPVTISDLEGIDMMEIPIDLDNSNIDILELNNKPELMQETHSNFLSLIRDIICSTNEHRMNLSTLEERLKSWQENPISPLNDWYSLVDNWVNLLKSAVNFLCGNSLEQPDDFVPYMEYKIPLDMYQWIGAGRDSDALLAPLCTYWLEHRSEAKSNKEKDKEEIDVEVSDRSQTPPPPRCPTNWTVRKATSEEIKEFREQERKRYDNPHKAFTYRCNGYESVVGPLKGIYNASVGNTKARGHTMLNADRPNFVTILSLVRDATARLPNGEGTRGDICELLKSSQYISSTAPDNVLQSVVSGALDRMHTQFDPCVKYDPKRKIWIYLHRNRTEEDFERIHQQYQGVNKSKKATSKKPKPKPKSDKVANKVTKSDDKPKGVTKVKSGDSGTSKANSLLISNQEKMPTSDEKEINEALQAIVQNRVSSSSPIIKQTPPKPKGLVKIISPTQGKSLIIPSSKQERATPPKQIVAQQLIQTIQAKQKQQSDAEKIELKTTQPQQFIQSITPQQLQAIKNVTLVREPKLGGALPEQIHIKTQATLTPAQQQQILQTIKQKILPQATVLNSQQQQQQQIVLKQKGLQKQTQQQVKVGIEGTKSLGSTQSPVVAKVLTNAAGQVISVESLLAHQKQHGSLPQGFVPGTTLRVSGTKGGPTNIIQLTGTSKQNPIAQFAVGSQNNIILTSQPKLVMASSSTTTTTTTTTCPSTLTTTITTTTTKPVARVTTNKTQQQAISATKFPPKIAQQLINAKLITTDGQKVVQPKIFMSQQNQVKLASAKNISLTSKPMTLAANANTIRMVNAANLNLTHIGGKPVLLASKGTTIQNIQGQNVILQTQPNTSGGSLVLQNAVKAIPTTQNNPNINIINQQNVVLGPQLKMQTPQQVVFSSGVKSVTTQGHIVLEGHPVRLQTSTATNTQRVVLASQGQGGQIVAQQILLPAGFQGTAINIKALQGVKVIPLAQAHGQGRGVQGRQVFARVMSPTVVKATTSTADKSADPTITSADM